MPAAISREPADHFLTDNGELVAVDLQHGSRVEALSIRRTWMGNETLNTHFGPGWSDANVFRLTLPSQDNVLIWRGGVGWRSAHRDRDKDEFSTAEGETIRKGPDGWTLKHPAGQVMTFDRNGFLVSQTTSAGPLLRYTYDDQNRLVTVGDTPENMLRYHYGQNGDQRVSRIDGPEGLVVTYRYDRNGRLGTATSARKVRSDYAYDSAGNLTTARDQFGNQLALKAAQTRRPMAKSDNRRSTAPRDANSALEALMLLPRPTFTFDDLGRVIEKNENGWRTQYAYNPAGQTESVVTPVGRTSYEYDTFGREIAITHPDGRTTQIEYNSLDLPTSILAPDGIRTTFTYNALGMLTRREESPQEWEEFEYDDAGRLSIVRTAPAFEERYSYDNQDRVARVRYSNGRDVRFVYDNSGKLLSEQWSTGAWTRWAYDKGGRVIKIEDSSGLITSNTYDRDGTLVATKDNVQGERRFPATDSLTQQTVEKESEGKYSLETTPWGQPLVVIRPSGQKTVFQYSPRGNPLQVVSPSGLSWHYKYDKADRLVGITAPGDFRTTLSHDEAGRVEAITRGGVVWRRYRSDALGRTKSVESAAGLVAEYKYGNDGGLTEARYPDGSVSYEVDRSGRQMALKGPDYQLEEQYHPDGSLSRKIYQPAQLDLKLPLDRQGRPAGVELNDLKARYIYGDRGQLERIQLPAGVTITITSDAAERPVKLVFGNTLTMNITYDRAGRITAIEAAAPKGDKPIFAERYTYDRAGNLVALEADPGGPKRLQYDAEDRLVKVTQGTAAQSYEYDAGGNLWAAASGDKVQRWTLDQLGRPTAQGPLSYEWDASGNLAATQSLHAKVENSFDTAGRLVRRRIDKLEWRFGYLPDGDRLWQESDRGRIWYAYVDEGLIGFKDEQGVTWLIVMLPGTDLPLALTGSNGKTYFAIADRLHSLRRLVDTAGVVAARADYGPFGKRESTAGLRKLGLFAGMVRDDSGLYYARQRYYDPHLARFISMDPELGSVNLPASHNPYAYAANNPYRFRDSGGTMPFTPEVSARIDARRAAFKPPRFPATEIRSSFGIMAHPENAHLLNPGQLEELNGMMKALEREQSLLRHPEASAAMREAAQQRIEQMANRVSEIAKDYKQNNLSRFPPPAARPANPTRLDKGLGPAKLRTGQAPRMPPSNLPAVRPGSSPVKPPLIRRIPSNNAATLSLEERLARQAARGAGQGGLRRIAGGAATVLGTLWDLWNIGSAGAEGVSLLGADDEDINARKQSSKTIDDLENRLRKALQDPANQNRIIPRGFTGEPDDIDSLVGTMKANLANGQRPFDGILTDPGKTVPVEAQKGLQAALKAARGLILQGRVLELSIRNAENSAAQQDGEARGKLADAMMTAKLQQPYYQQLANLPGAAADVRTRTAAVRSATGNLQAARQAFRAASGQAQQAANIVCQYARRSASASQEDVNAWKAQAASLTNQSIGALDAAQARIYGAAISTDELRQSMDRLEAFQDTIDLLPAPAAVTNALAAARAAVRAGSQYRAPIAGWLQEIASIRTRVKAVLEPYSWADETAVVIAEAEVLGAGLQPPSPILNMDHMMAAATEVADAFLMWATNAEKTLQTVDVKQLLAEAAAAHREAATLSTDAAPRPAMYWPVQQAQQCYSEIKFTPKPQEGIASQDTPPATAQPPAKVKVPLVLLMPEEQAKATLIGAGFNVARLDSPTRTPSEQEAGTVQRQDPNAGDEADQGSTVTLTIYRKFGEEPPAAPEPTDRTKVRVRSVLTLSPAEARAVLQRDGLRVSLVRTRIDTPQKEKEFTIQRQDPAGGALVDKGSVVTLAVYGPYQDESGRTAPDTTVDKTRVPSLRGLTQTQAIEKLDQFGLTVGGIEISGTPPEGAKPNTVNISIPAAGEKIPADKRVTLKLYGSAGTPAPPPETPPPGGPEGPVVPGTSAELVGKWKGKATTVEGAGRGGTREITAEITRKPDNSYEIVLPLDPPLLILGGSTGKTTVRDGTIRWEFTEVVGGQTGQIILELTVSNGKLVGYLATIGGQNPARGRIEMQRVQ